MSFAPGMTIGSNLRLVGLLAKGGMGSVWVAEHLALQTQVAVKFLSEGSLSDTAASRFEQEAAAMARLKSPHVVQVFDFGLAPGGIPYISMDLLEGESLGGRLRKRRRLSTVETAAIVMQTCRALARAHELDVVHRDIKPDNIFLTDSGGELFVKVLDFGIAKKTGAGALGMTHSGMTIGTPFYMSPEQMLSARTVTRGADLWALAAVAYECLTGQVPFTGESYGGLCLAISAGRFEPPSRIQPELPASIDAWFTRAFQPNEKARFNSAGDLARSFLAAGLVSRAEAMTVPSGLGQRRQSYPSSGRLLTVQVEGGPARSLAAARELSMDAQVPTQRSVVADEPEPLHQISRLSLGGPSPSAPPVAGHVASARPRRVSWKLMTFAIVGLAATIAVTLARWERVTPSASADLRVVALPTGPEAQPLEHGRPLPAQPLDERARAAPDSATTATSPSSKDAPATVAPRPPASPPTPPPTRTVPREAAATTARGAPSDPPVPTVTSSFSPPPAAEPPAPRKTDHGF